MSINCIIYAILLEKKLCIFFSNLTILVWYVFVKWLLENQQQVMVVSDWNLNPQETEAGRLSHGQPGLYNKILFQK